jgi:hypothetical protein
LLRPKYFAEWRALMVGIAASNFCPSLLECTVSSMSKWRKMGSRAVALAKRSFASFRVSRRM